MSMKIKKFTAETVQQALNQVKEVLGPDAVILHIEEREAGRKKPRAVEVTAAVDEEFRRLPDVPLPGFGGPRRGPGESRGKVDFLLDEKAVPRRSVPPFSEGTGTSAPPGPKLEVSLTAELKRLQSQMTALTLLLSRSGHPELPPELMDVYARLIESGVSRQLAAEIMRQIEHNLSGRRGASRRFILREVRRVIETILRRSQMNTLQNRPEAKVKVFVGPTGVGKTTSIAKLAAADKIFRRLRVGLVSLDTYRIAAIEQLRTYARISKIPLEIVYTPGEMSSALKSLSGCDVIYVDTPGRSQKNGEGLREIRRFIEEIPNPEVHLVLSLTNKMEDLQEVWERFSFFPVRRLLFTKLDETNSTGTLLNLVYQANRPVSYIANGQNVPDDIFKADVKWIAESIVGEQAA